MKFVRGDVIKHSDGSIYVIEKVFSRKGTARLSIIVETEPAAWPGWYQDVGLSDVFKKIAHAELDEEEQK